MAWWTRWWMQQFGLVGKKHPTATGIWGIGGIVNKMVDAAVWARRQETSDGYRHLRNRRQR